MGSVKGRVYWMGVVIVEGEGTDLGVNLGRPIVTNRSLLHRCAAVHEWIELLFG